MAPGQVQGEGSGVKAKAVGYRIGWRTDSGDTPVIGPPLTNTQIPSGTAAVRSALDVDDDESRRIAATLNADLLHDPVFVARLPLDGPGELRVWDLGDGVRGEPLAVVWSLVVPSERVEVVRQLVAEFAALVRGEPDRRPVVVVCEGLERRKNTLVSFVRELVAAVLHPREHEGDGA
jgi:hypothetical protein